MYLGQFGPAIFTFLWFFFRKNKGEYFDNSIKRFFPRGVHLLYISLFVHYLLLIYTLLSNTYSNLNYTSLCRGVLW